MRLPCSRITCALTPIRRCPAPRSRADFGALDGLDVISLDAQGAAQRMPRRENLADAPAAQFVGASAEKFFDRRAHQHGAAFAVEQQQAVAEPTHHLVEVFAHGAENLAHIVQLLSDPGNFRADQRRVRRLAATAGSASNSPAEMRSSCSEMRASGASVIWLTSKRQQRGKQNGSKRPVARRLEARGNLVAHKRRGKADANVAERAGAQAERKRIFVGLRRPVKRAQLFDETAVRPENPRRGGPAPSGRAWRRRSKPERFHLCPLMVIS